MAHLLGVEVGEVFFNRRFGADLRNLVFRPNDLTLHTQIEFVITQAIETFKKTVIIRLIGVEPDPDDRTRVNVSLTYAIRRTNVVGNFVFPLYLRQLARLAGESSLRQ
jgi:phage baseplate assembly protein W